MPEEQKTFLSGKGYVLDSPIIEGSSCTVFKVKKVTPPYVGTIFALKQIDVRTIGLNKIMREVNILRKLSHEYIVKMIDCLEFRDKVSIVFEFAQRGDLITLVERSTEFIPMDRCRLWFRQIVLSLLHLRRLLIAHRDIKADNVLLFADRVKLTDFGHACECTERPDGSIVGMTDYCGTFEYNAPETILLKEPYDPFVSDIFMLGVLLHVIVTLEFPFEADRNPETYHRKIVDKVRNVPNIVKSNPDFRALIDALLEPVPSKRIGLMQAIDHPWTVNDIVAQRKVSPMK